MPTATLKMFLAFGDPKRLRIVELSNWTGKAVAGPRSEFEKVLERRIHKLWCLFHGNRSGYQQECDLYR